VNSYRKISTNICPYDQLMYCVTILFCINQLKLVQIKKAYIFTESRLAMLIALTGATGFVGQSILPKLREIGDVIEIQAFGGNGKFRLNQASNIAAIKPDVLIHCAMTRVSNRKIDEDVNFLGAKRLLNETVGNSNLKIIFISSLSSHSNSLSQYGHSKFRIEELFSKSPNAFVLRAGVICAEPAGGFEKILKKIANFPFILISISKIKLYVTPVEMLVKAIASIIENSASPNLRRAIIAEPESVTFTDFLTKQRSRVQLILFEISLIRLMKMIHFCENFLHLNIGIFDSIKSVSTHGETRNYSWDFR
jgi:dTDP-4-dehydrorhamnose reductase